MGRRALGLLFATTLATAGCGSSKGATLHNDTTQGSNIQHVVLIVEENHSFDSYFGNYCQAPAGSNPSCNLGPPCCEAAPATDPSGATPDTLDDALLNSASNEAHDRNHAQDCELSQIDNGAMDQYVTGSTVNDGLTSPTCSTGRNFALANSGTMSTYWGYAANGALADRYFQPIVGSTSSNDMYLAVAHFQFVNNADRPEAINSLCLGNVSGTPTQWTGVTTVADLLVSNNLTFGVYADGYADAQNAAAGCSGVPWELANINCCPSISVYPSDCPWLIPDATACNFDPSDIAFEYYSQFTDNTQYMHDFTQFANDLQNNNLPTFSYVKARTYRNEHPGWSTIGRGVSFVDGVVKAVLNSSYQSNTLILLTWDEGGGFFDHVSPPAPVPTQYDQDASGNPVPYGTRVPLLAIGQFALANTVSHVQMEHSSIIAFLEYNFLGAQAVGSLGSRDAVVSNLGSLLDPNQTGITIPQELDRLQKPADDYAHVPGETERSQVPDAQSAAA